MTFKQKGVKYHIIIIFIHLHSRRCDTHTIKIKQKNRHRALKLESLEERQLLTAAPYATAPTEPEAIFQTAVLPNTVEDPIEATTAVTLTETAASASAPLLPTADASLTIPAGYNAHDYTALYNFLEQTDSSGVKNGKRLNTSYNSATPTTWPGVTWTDVNGEKRISGLYLENKSLSGNLDVSRCTALTTLNCYDNALTTLDISGCTALTYLGCHNNKLTTLDVSGCTALTELNCYYNDLTELDISNCTNLTKLNVSHNNLMKLDVSSCKALTTLSYFNNNITSLDVSNNTVLKTLYCGNISTSPDMSKKHNCIRISPNVIGTLDIYAGIEWKFINSIGKQVGTSSYSSDNVYQYYRLSTLPVTAQSVQTASSQSTFRRNRSFSLQRQR